MLVLLIPESLTLPWWDFSLTLRDTLLTLTISVVLTSLFIQTLCIKPAIKHLNIEQISDIDIYKKYFTEIISYNESVIKLEQIRKARYVEDGEWLQLSLHYEQKIQNTQEKILSLSKKYKWIFWNLQKRVYALYALSIEEKALLNLYRKDQIPEEIFKKILLRIKYQQERIESGKWKIQSTKYIDPQKNIIEVFSENIMSYIETKEENTIVSEYYELRTLNTIIQKALSGLQDLQNYGYFQKQTELQDIIDDYKSFHQDAERNRRALFWWHQDELKWLSGLLTHNSLISDEILHIERYLADKVITEQISEMLLEERV